MITLRYLSTLQEEDSLRIQEDVAFEFVNSEGS